MYPNTYTMDRKELMNEIYDAILVLGKIVGIRLGTPETLQSTAKLAIAISGGALTIKYLKDKNICQLTHLNLTNCIYNGECCYIWIVQCIFFCRDFVFILPLK